jgi:hypothetical protein
LRLVIAERQGFGLRKADLACRKRGLGLITQIVQHEAAFDGRLRKARLCREIIESSALSDEHGERRCLV